MPKADNFDFNLADKHTLSTGTFYFYKNIILAEVNEGTELNLDNSSKLLQLIEEYYGNNTPFIYITNRKNSYSFTPTAHFKIAQMFPNGKAYAIVSHNALNNKIGELEQTFLNIPSEIFGTIDEAIEWGQGIIATT